MKNPFPGMNPYLEQPEFWLDFHTKLVTALARVLIPQVLPKYRVVTEKWIYQIADAATIGIGRPDITVQQRRGESSERAIASPIFSFPYVYRIQNSSSICKRSLTICMSSWVTVISSTIITRRLLGCQKKLPLSKRFRAIRLENCDRTYKIRDN